MKLFRLVEVDLGAERKRIKKKGLYTRRQRTALLKLCDLFEAGDWQGCLDHVRDVKAFPYNEHGEYPEVEHIGSAISDVLLALGEANFFTQQQLLDEVRSSDSPAP